MDLYQRLAHPELAEPVLVLALDGWIDAGAGAATAMAALLAGRRTEVVARFDSDALLDHRARRPVMRIVDGVNTGLTWPTTELRATTDDRGRDVLVLVGAEPDQGWHAFTAAVVGLAGELGVRLVVGLGAFPAPVPHTRPVRLASTATEPALALRVGFIPGALDVPAGIQAALEWAFGQAGVPAVGLWARVPHYVATMAYPAASVALLDGLATVAGLSFDAGDLHEAAVRTRAHVDELITNSAEHQQMVRQLESQVDAEVPAGGPATDGNAELHQPLPSGEEIAAELERFLRGESGG